MIQMPPAQELKKFFAQEGLSDFVQRTGIIELLANQNVSLFYLCNLKHSTLASYNMQFAQYSGIDRTKLACTIYAIRVKLDTLLDSVFSQKSVPLH